MRYLGAIILVGLAFAARASARDIYVNNVAGDDRFSGAAPATADARTGPCRTIAQALRLAEKGDRIVLAATGVPYRESITLQAGRHSGFRDRPFQIVGSGAILHGAAPVPRGGWQHVDRDLYRFAPPRKSFQLLFLDGQPAVRVPVERGAVRLPELEPQQWCLFQGEVYFCADAGRIPESYDVEYCDLPVGVTLYEVRNVVIQDLIVQGFQQDGVNAHDGVFDAQLQRLTCRGNARSGLSVGGASRVQVSQCLLGGNGTAQLRTEGYSQAQLRGSQLVENTAPSIHRQGGSVLFEPDRH